MSYRITEERITCGTCIDECPVEALGEGDDTYSIDRESCNECGS